MTRINPQYQLLNALQPSELSKLRTKRVAVVGAGGLGSPLVASLCLLELAELRIIEFDHVELSNLQRQILYRSGDCGRLKTDALRRYSCDNLVIEPTRLEASNAHSCLSGVDLICDGSDNFDTRFLVNDTAISLTTPYVFAGVVRFSGQLLTIVPGRGPCYRCIFESNPADQDLLNCSAAGVLGAMVGIVAGLQFDEALRLLLGKPPIYLSRMLILDGWNFRSRSIELTQRADCTTCGGDHL